MDRKARRGSKSSSNAPSVSSTSPISKAPISTSPKTDPGICMMMKAGGVAIGLVLALTIVPATAQDVAEFYKGKNVTMVVGTPAGGGYDIYARLLARYMGK